MATVPPNVALFTVMVNCSVKLVVGDAPFTIVASTVAVPELVVLRIFPPLMVAPVVPEFCTVHEIV